LVLCKITQACTGVWWGQPLNGADVKFLIGIIKNEKKSKKTKLLEIKIPLI
jgi:hypothetical protein